MKPAWKKYLLYGSVIVIGGILLFVLIETVRAKNTGFETKTLWDWLELLIIPLVLAIGAFYLERSDRAVERKAADDRAKLERELATDRQQEASLQAYLDRMAELLLMEKPLTPENEAVWNVARVRTLTVLRGLDSRRKGFVTQFLREAGLIIGPDPVVSLGGADLRGADLFSEDLREVNLDGANLEDANLGYAILEMAYLVGAILNRANLLGAKLSNANLQAAVLQSADLELANLQDADLQGAVLTRAVLKNAELSGANLRRAFVSDSQLAAAKSLKGATMPDGTKHD